MATFRNITILDLFMRIRLRPVSLSDRCGLEHLRVISSHWMKDTNNMIRRQPTCGMMDDEEMDDALEQVS